MMSLGAKGVISVVSNILPEVMVKMSHLCLEGNFEEAAKLQIEYIDLSNALFMEVNPIPVKAAMELMGLCSGNIRLPLCEMTPEHHVALREILSSLRHCAEKLRHLTWYERSLFPAATAAWAG